MTKDLNALLDECIDRMNEGESLKECLADYPEQAEELRPLLTAMCNLRDACSNMPSAMAKSAVRRRLDAALVNSDRGLQKHERRTKSFFGWSRVWAAVATALVLAFVGFGLNLMLTPGVAPVVAQDNFRLLLSDEENDIGDFQSLEVTITSIGVLRGGEGGGWEVIQLEPSVVADLTRLQGLNAQEIWSGILPEGQYTQVFIYIEDAIGTLKNGETVNVMVPSGNLQISKPFVVTAGDSVVNFVHDVTAVAAGNEYILLPQVDQSGSYQSYHEVGEGQLTLWIEDPAPPTPVTPGEEITVIVTFEGDPVPGAQVRVNGEHYGNTNSDGLISFPVPIAKELKIKAEVGTEPDELEGQLRIDFGDELTLEIVDGEVTPGEEITVLVTFETLQGSTILIQDAQVEVNGEGIGATDMDGLISFMVPYDDELEIEAVLGELKGELEIDLEGESEEGELTLEVIDPVSPYDPVPLGEVTPGMSVKVLVTLADGSPVPGAIVTVEDAGDFLTDSDGRTDSFIVPDEDELEIEAVKDELEGELEIEFENVGDTNEGELTLEVVAGDVIPGEEITVLVSFEGNPVTGALVTVNDEEIGETDADGLISFIVPDEDELEIEAVKDELKGELEIDLEGESEEGELTLEVVAGEVTPGEEITVLVTSEGDPVSGALVTVNDEEIGETDADGLISFIVPDEEELEIEAVKDELKGELEYDL